MSSADSDYGRNARRNQAVRARPADWKLPPGVAPGTWDYANIPEIATQYDSFLDGTPLLTTDLEWLLEALPLSGHEGQIVADLGCGTGRTLPILHSLGYRMLAVDLSQAMLVETFKRGVKNREEPTGAQVPKELLDSGASLRVIDRIPAPLCLRANLVTLDCLRDASMDHAVCLFSTFGMIRGRTNRRRMLAHVRRILKPGGLFLLHVHHRWASLYDPGGWKFLAKSLWRSARSSDFEFGDRVYGYRGLPNMFLHSFGARELRDDLKAAGLDVLKWKSLNLRGDGLSASEKGIQRWLAGGFMVVAGPVE